MYRPARWIAVPLALILLLLFGIRPEASMLQENAAVLPVNPDVPLSMEGCVSVVERAEYEKADCLQAVRMELAEGTITLAQAMRRLEECAAGREDLATLELRRARLRSDLYRARVAYGEPLSEAELEENAALSERFETVAMVPPGAVARLREAGIAPHGVTGGGEGGALARLASSPELRGDFRAAFGDILADDLEAILARRPGSRAVVVGSTVIVPNVAAPVAAGGPAQQNGSTGVESSPRPLVVGIDAYSARVAAELQALEMARRAYFTAAARENHYTGSVETFLAGLRRRDVEARSAELHVAAEAEQARMEVRLTNLEQRLGLDPLALRMAGESAGLAVELNRGCRRAAESRRLWVRRGAGLVTGLVGAAGAVVVTGATGTLIGGETIAAAVEATIGAYFVARSERLAASRVIADADTLSPTQPVEDAPERLARLTEDEVELNDGFVGAGEGESDTWFEDTGEALERLGLEGEGIDEEDGGSTEPGVRTNTIPPILPVELPAELRELPPLLATADLRELRGLTLPEIQERLDEFLALTDPSAWAMSESDEAVRPVSLEAMLSEAATALKLWETRRQLAAGFGPFFVQAEVEDVPPGQQGDVLLRAMGRYTHDRDLYLGSADVADVRERVANRLVTHCRAGDPHGDLILSACTDETALSILLIATLRETNIRPPAGSEVGVQVFDDRFEAVLYSKGENRVFSLTKGSFQEGVVAPIYYPATFYYSYLVAHGVVPEIDPDQHLLMALPDRAMPVEAIATCEEAGGAAGVVGRAVEWLGSMMGVRRVSDGCGGSSKPSGTRDSGGDSGFGVDISLPMPRNPLNGGGGGQSGGSSGGGGGSGSGNPLAGAGATDPGGDSSSGGGGQQAGGASSGGQGSGDSAEDGAGLAESGGGGAGQGSGTSDGGTPDPSATGTSSDGQDGQTAQNDGTGADAGAGSGPSDGSSAGGSGGYGLSGATLAGGPDLARIGEESVRLATEYERNGSLGVMPWRLREDEGMLTGSSTRVLYADNERALERFDPDDLFITLTPAEVEAQRRMLEADAFPIFQAETECGAPNLPPRGVFRRAAAGESGFRYVYCSEEESMVIFRDQDDAEDYATLNAPDRPLFLSRLALERLERFERNPEVVRLRSFISDPNVLRGYTREEIYAMAKAAGDLLVFQNALESALVQSMNELGPSEIRGYYYDMHREVLQAPLFLSIAESVHTLNQRLASDPLQSLAWANAQPRLARQGFFDLYHTLGGMMEWPERWATLQQRYGTQNVAPPAADPDAPSLDFLQILSDPTRVQVDWTGEITGAPSIRDRQVQDGAARTPEERPEPTASELLEMQDEIEHQRGGTGGLGRAGDGESLGPESGNRPLQMIQIRITTGEDEEPVGQKAPDDNRVRPGGTEGRERRQTEESASRQEPMLWISPHTFIEAILSPWDGRGLRAATADRVPPILRFNGALREVFLRDLHPADVYDNRLRTAMEVFTAGEWLKYEEVREAMGGSQATVKARDTGRFSAAYAGNPPINDQDQIRIPNFFTSAGSIIPADLFEPVREHYTQSLLGIFELERSGAVAPAVPLQSLPVEPGETSEAARTSLLRGLEMIRGQAEEAERMER